MNSSITHAQNSSHHRIPNGLLSNIEHTPSSTTIQWKLFMCIQWQPTPYFFFKKFDFHNILTCNVYYFLWRGIQNLTLTYHSGICIVQCTIQTFQFFKWSVYNAIFLFHSFNRVCIYRPFRNMFSWQHSQFSHTIPTYISQHITIFLNEFLAYHYSMKRYHNLTLKSAYKLWMYREEGNLTSANLEIH